MFSVWSAEKSKIKVLADSISVQGSPSGLQIQPSCSILLRALIPSWASALMISPRLNQLPKALSLSMITLGVRALRET